MRTHRTRAAAGGASRLAGVALLVDLAAPGLGGCATPRVARAVLEAFPWEGAAPLLVEFRLDGSTYGKNPGSFTLDFGDGTAAVQGDDLRIRIPHVYGQLATYTAPLSVVSGDGQAATATAIVRVIDGSDVEDGATVGKRAFDFTAQTTGGATVTLSELRGQVVLIEFSGSWCVPCRQSMPHIYALWGAYHDEGLIVLAVSTDEQAGESVAYLEANGHTDLTCIWEPGGRSTRIKLLYQVDWIPRTILVDRAGIVRYNGHPMDLTESLVETVLTTPAP
ncbi:MAG: redoxin domain-containing protein [Candidatus Bipolaricaulota bacterium]